MKKINNEDYKFKIGDIARVSKHKTIFAKVFIPNWAGEVFVIKKVKNTVPWRYVIIDLNKDKFDIDKFKNVPSYLINLKSKADKIDFDKLVPVPVKLK